MRILLIDDDPFILKLLCQQLAQLGFQDAIACERPRDALRLLADEADTIDLVICDLQMPELDGIEVVRHLAAIGYHGDLVLTSGESDRILQTAALLANAHRLNVRGTVTKPIALTQLKTLLGEAPACARTATAPVGGQYSEDAVKRALVRNELVNYYQPKVELSTGRVNSVEALVRWRHPKDGLVFPDQFISTAETSGLIDDLTRRVLCGALRDASHWRRAGLDLRVAVNISMDNLGALEFPEFVERSVREAGLPMSSLILELTESRLMTDPVAPLDILTRLRLKRVGLSIDDFGTGHSSLAQLRDIPFDELKVDRGFVHGAARNPSLSAIVEASLDMARHLDMTTVGEGVEDKEDWDFLFRAGCDLAQGYFIARPMPADDLPAWTLEWTARLGSTIALG